MLPIPGGQTVLCHAEEEIYLDGGIFLTTLLRSSFIDRLVGQRPGS